jgi:poly(3-hydroxybutyrate) depolymerase
MKPLASDAAPDPNPVALPPPVLPPREIGPYEIPFRAKRSVYYALPVSREKSQRLIANLHGVCNPPGYACGYWVPSASQHGVMVCPRGNGECAPGVSTWNEPVAKIDQDLEDSVAAVDAAHPGEIRREGAFLTGFSLGASVAPTIAKSHPGRWSRSSQERGGRTCTGRRRSPER